MVLHRPYSDALQPAIQHRSEPAETPRADSVWPLTRLEACILAMVAVLATVLISQDRWVAAAVSLVLCVVYAAAAWWLARTESKDAANRDCHRYD